MGLRRLKPNLAFGQLFDLKSKRNPTCRGDRPTSYRNIGHQTTAILVVACQHQRNHCPSTGCLVVADGTTIGTEAIAPETNASPVAGLLIIPSSATRSPNCTVSPSNSPAYLFR